MAVERLPAIETVDPQLRDRCANVEQPPKATYAGPTMSEKVQRCYSSGESKFCAPETGSRNGDFAVVALHRLLSLAADLRQAPPCEVLSGSAWGFPEQRAATLWRHMCAITPQDLTLLSSTDWNNLVKSATHDISGLEKVRDCWRRHIEAVADVAQTTSTEGAPWDEEKLYQLAATGYWHCRKDLEQTLTAVIQVRKARLSDLVVESLAAHVELLASTHEASQGKARFAVAVAQAEAKLGRRRSRHALACAVRLGVWSEADQVIDAHDRVHSLWQKLKKHYDGKLATLMSDAAASSSTSLADFEKKVSNHGQLYADLFYDDDRILIKVLTRLWSSSSHTQGRRGRPPAPPFEPLIVIGEAEISEGFLRKQRQRLRRRASEFITSVVEYSSNEGDCSPLVKTRCIRRIVDACVAKAELERRVALRRESEFTQRWEWLQTSRSIIDAAERAVKALTQLSESAVTTSEFQTTAATLKRLREQIELAEDRMTASQKPTWTDQTQHPGGRRC
ncbi:MAG: hypothetical protein GY906_14610 [bacterium]|nr:hypothetical protein [bacterium]